MAKMRGKWLFAGRIYVQGAPILHTASTIETEWPYRECRKSIIVRLGRKKKSVPALVLGIWTKGSGNESEQLLKALDGYEIEKEQAEAILGDISLRESNQEGKDDVSVRDAGLD